MYGAETIVKHPRRIIEKRKVDESGTGPDSCLTGYTTRQIATGVVARMYRASAHAHNLTLAGRALKRADRKASVSCSTNERFEKPWGCRAQNDKKRADAQWNFRDTFYISEHSDCCYTVRSQKWLKRGEWSLAATVCDHFVVFVTIWQSAFIGWKETRAQKGTNCLGEQQNRKRACRSKMMWALSWSSDPSEAAKAHQLQARRKTGRYPGYI